MIRIGLIQFPGSNCERETGLAVKRAGMEPIDFLWNENPQKLQSMDGYIIVGGFSYEDRARAGIIAALDPIMQEIKRQSLTGKPVLGICNGAQILVETGMIPGLSQHGQSLALTENKRMLGEKILGRGFYNNWINIRLSQNYKPNAFNRHLLANNILSVPVAHGEGRFVMTEALLTTLQEEGLDLFQYCDTEGNLSHDFPVNPNGSMGNIAAIVNQAGNVMAMMPHPERTSQGDPIFTSIRDYILEGKKQIIPSSSSNSSLISPLSFQKAAQGHEIIVKQIITDNHALTVEKTLRKLGMPVSVKRFQHWEIESDCLGAIQAAKDTGVLYCERKEREIASSELNLDDKVSYLVRAKDNLFGQQTLQTLKNHYSIQGISHINYGILWQFKSDDANIHKLLDDIFATHIMGNPYAHEYYQYC